MINQEVELESESVSGTEDSVSSHQENRGRLESMKKLKKVRSIKLHRLSSMRSSTKRGKPQSEKNLSIFSSIGTESSDVPTLVEIISDASPHYMMGTSSSHAKESFQNTQGVFTKKHLTRVSTLKLKRSLTRKLSGRNDQKRKLKSSRSIKIGSFKAPKSTRKASESIHGSDDHNRISSLDDGNSKPQRAIARRLSFKPVRILTKVPTFRSKNSSMEKCHHASQCSEPSLHRATCSSTLKDSHFSDHIELPQEGSGSSQVVSTMKICPYTYCSLHGHRRDDLPPLKRFVSMRRRQLKTQKSKKMDGGPVARSKQSGNARKATQKTRSFHGEKGSSHLQNLKNREKDSSKGSTLAQGGTSSRGVDEDKYNFRYDVIDFEESTSMEVFDSSASDIGTLEGVVTKGENMEGDYEAMQVTSAQKEAESACATDVSNKMQERDDRYMTMWQLVYKHAVLANTGKEEDKLPFDGNEKEGKGKEAQSFDADDENKSLIDLVQKAFDEILLPEPEDLSSRGVGSDEELSEKSDGGGGEGNISASREPPQEETLPEDDSIRSHAEEKTGLRIREFKPDSKTPKSWSNLKKILVFRRFVKVLEKARKLNFRRPRHLPSDADFEAEKVFLKHQTAEERRNSEEWMLDYALQKVISKLAPVQRQRVSLLVEAFETFRPFQDAQSGSLTLSSTTMGTQANPVKPPYDHGKEETDTDNSSNNPIHELHNPVVLKERVLDYPDTEIVEKRPTHGATKEELNSKQSLTSSYDDQEKALDHNAENEVSRSRPLESISSFHDESDPTPTNGIVNEVPKELTDLSESPGGDFETKNEIGANSEQFSLSKSLILKGLAKSLGTGLIDEDERRLDRKERIEKANEQSKAPMSGIVEPETRPEKQNHTGMWYLVYKHMVSDLAENDSKSQSYETVSENESSSSIVSDKEVEQQQIEAIKMVEEAIDSIIPDDHHNTEQSSRSERVCIEGLNQIKEEKIASGIGTTQEQKEEEAARKDGNKPKQKLSRSWSNLKKVILLRRFIKALEKVREFNPRGPRYLPIEADEEAEKVSLRHQDMGGRKGTEEWMLDYALRQVVSKLTPERKRKVELLVEAFETVIPTINN